MTSLRQCFVDEAIEPVKLIEVPPSSAENYKSDLAIHEFLDPQSLSSYMEDGRNRDFTYRFMYAIELDHLVNSLTLFLDRYANATHGDRCRSQSR